MSISKKEFDEVFDRIFEKVPDENGGYRLVERVHYPPIIEIPGIAEKIQKSLNTPNYERSNDVYTFC